MFSAGQFVVYGSTGVCKIEDIRKESFAGQSRSYYILKPAYSNNSTIYAPVGNSESKMKETISRQEINSLIELMTDCDSVWIEDDNERKEKYTAIIKSGDHKRLVVMLKTLHLKQKEKVRIGRKFHSADEKIMKEGEKILFEEFALALELMPNDIPEYIRSRVGELLDRQEESEAI